jgi:hypothetical protein
VAKARQGKAGQGRARQGETGTATAWECGAEMEGDRHRTGLDVGVSVAAVTRWASGGGGRLELSKREAWLVTSVWLKSGSWGALRSEQQYRGGG